MNGQVVEDRPRRKAWIGLAAAAVGASAVGLYRLSLRERARRWEAHLNRGPNRTALVTGASAGIGRAFAHRLAEQGYRLVLVARRAERLAALSTEFETLYGKPAEAVVADLSTEAGIAAVEQRLAAGDVDFLVNNAGYDVFGQFAHIPIADCLGLIQCLELATVRLTRAALPAMLGRRRGAVVNVSSAIAFAPKRLDSIYVSSKAFVNRFSESLALELSGSGVRIQALCPGFTRTEFHADPQFQPYRVYERLPAWLWMEPEQVVSESLRSLGEDRVICVPGFKNKLIVGFAKSGLSSVLMRAFASFIPKLGPESAWDETDLQMLACPQCHAPLASSGKDGEGKLVCSGCGKSYPIAEGIPRFADYSDLGGSNRSLAGLYDWFSIFYRLYSKAAFAFIGTTEDRARLELLDRLEPCGNVLEISVGPGVNLPYLREYPAVRKIFGLDLSNGQLARCRSFARRNNWPVSLYQGNAEALPFRDGSFDSVFHIGGINFFENQSKAIAEMIRVARPGARILICDETERGARAYELTLPGFKQSLKANRPPVRPPVDLIPPEMEAVKLDEGAWNGWFYCLEFRKPMMNSHVDGIK